ncbi:MAG TPA: PepSY domain-containing protein, partial [Terricaulis sp.]|nr:PepSY domain-containing protein [Terricaulis sp.]
MRRRLLLAALLAGLAFAPAPAAADDDDHDRARAAVSRRDALPLTRILEIAQRVAPGEVVEVDLDDDDGRLVYEIETLARN